MRLRPALLGIFIAICGVLLGSSAYAQSDNNQPAPPAAPAPQPINPLTGPSFPCPQPTDPLAQLICSTPQLALLDMQFVQSYKALYQQVGTDADPALRHQDYEFDLAVRSQCNITNPAATGTRRRGAMRYSSLPTTDRNLEGTVTGTSVGGGKSVDTRSTHTAIPLASIRVSPGKGTD
jgi:hypothetical protein